MTNDVRASLSDQLMKKLKFWTYRCKFHGWPVSKNIKRILLNENTSEAEQWQMFCREKEENFEISVMTCLLIPTLFMRMWKLPWKFNWHYLIPQLGSKVIWCTWTCEYLVKLNNDRKQTKLALHAWSTHTSESLMEAVVNRLAEDRLTFQFQKNMLYSFPQYYLKFVY